MKKRGETKVKICISIDKSTYSKIKKHCDKNLIKISTYINHSLKEVSKKLK